MTFDLLLGIALDGNDDSAQSLRARMGRFLSSTVSKLHNSNDNFHFVFEATQGASTDDLVRQIAPSCDTIERGESDSPGDNPDAHSQL